MGLLLSYFSSFSVLIPLIVGIIFFRRYTLAYKVLTVLVFIGAVAEALLYSTLESESISVLNIYTLVEFSFIAFFFIKSFERKRDQQITYTLLILFVLLNIYLSVVTDNFNAINSIGLITESVFVLVIALLLFFEIVNEQSGDLLTSPDIWFIIGLLLYFGGNFFTFGYSSSYIVDSGDFPFDLWITHSIFNIIFNLCISISLWFAKRRTVVG